MMFRLTRFERNPIISPNEKNNWEAKATFNAAAIYLENKVHIIYRALSKDDKSTLGYASSKNGFDLEERLNEPIYFPRIEEEKIGTEDPRITEIDEKIYMCYTAYNGSIFRVAMTSISKKDFLSKIWNWEHPKIISPPNVFDKNACVIKVGEKFAFFHRIQPFIWVDFKEKINLENDYIWGHYYNFKTRENSWDDEKIGIAAPPLKTNYGWILIYHGVSSKDKKYRLGAMLLDIKNPTKIISRLKEPILEPEVWYENEGLRYGTVFSCGAVIIKNKLLVYYGSADKYLSVAYCELKELIEEFRKEKDFTF